MRGVFRAAGIRVGSLRDRRRLGFLAWGARGERKVHSRVFEISPFVLTKSYRIGWLALQLHVQSMTVTLTTSHMSKTKPKKYLRAGREQL